jgi:hypothetical protein
MSNYPPPPPGDLLHYAGPPVPQPSRRPKSATVLGIIAIILGSLGILAATCTMPQYFISAFPNPVSSEIRKDAVLVGVFVAQASAQLCLSVIALWSGVELLRMKPAARRWMIRYAVLYLIMVAVGWTINLGFTHARTAKALDRAYAANPRLNTPQTKTIRQYTTYGGVCVSMVFLIWPISIFYYLSQPHVKAAYGETADRFTL